MNIINKRLTSFLKSFKFAFNGLIASIKTERNMRVHLCAAFYVLIFMQFYDLSNSEKVIIFLTMGIVISLELVNTAIESVVNLCSPKYHVLAKKAKDASAGAVLVSAIVSVAVAVEVFWDVSVFYNIYNFFISNLLALFGLVLSLLIWIIFIFVYDVKN